MKLQGEVKTELFTSPDNQLIAQVKRVLRSSGYAPLAKVRVMAVQGEVCLEGEVPTYFMKQLAQTHVLPIEGVRRLNNELNVDRQFHHLK
ncbi:BON domain protein [Gimesia panareensis]|uniref:BON domain protein n=1 Tax=Gimesia panareensis TaxID=2527978 RepID=A0A518FMS3_9PLAN|nr:BON domain-containing protein [Gimesia panareensis]QDV17656.1 BON domain protein [Gimesia panareensis]